MKTNDKPKLYLIPNFLNDQISPENVFPEYNKMVIRNLTHFIAEHEKSARRLIKSILPQKSQNELHFFLLNKHTPVAELGNFLQPMQKGYSMGLISDAGLPAIADPGSQIIHLARKYDFEIKPLVGPSSIFLALMASGLNGQHFEFHGYLPVNTPQLIKKVKQLENETIRQNKTQIFIETPYRNDRLLQILLKNLKENTMLCVAVDLTGPNEKIHTYNIALWRRKKLSFHKIPAVFLLGNSNTRQKL